jgi:hypothetical protein
MAGSLASANVPVCVCMTRKCFCRSLSCETCTLLSPAVLVRRFLRRVRSAIMPCGVSCYAGPQQHGKPDGQARASAQNPHSSRLAVACQVGHATRHRVGAVTRHAPGNQRTPDDTSSPRAGPGERANHVRLRIDEAHEHAGLPQLSGPSYLWAVLLHRGTVRTLLRS